MPDRGRRKSAKMGIFPVFACILSVLALSWVPAEAEAQSQLTLHLSPQGDDTRTGLTPTQAIQTLTRAHAIVEATLSTAHRDVEVVIAPGTYAGGQTVTWKFTMPRNRIVFRGAAGGENRPIFVSNGTGTWFSLRHARGQATNLVFEYIHVRDYSAAINLAGDRETSAKSNAGNRIYGMYFERVGQNSTAVIRLINSDANEIINNHFVDIVRKEKCSLLHAIYIAHDSSENRIERNRFVRNCGDPIRIRDSSNRNIVRDNEFIRSGINAGYTEWYCDKEVRRDCSKRGPECPSWGNEFRDNVLQSNWQGEKLRGFEHFQDDTQPGCATVPQGTMRLRTSGNK